MDRTSLDEQIADITLRADIEIVHAILEDRHPGYGFATMPVNLLDIPLALGDHPALRLCDMDEEGDADTDVAPADPAARTPLFGLTFTVESIRTTPVGVTGYSAFLAVDNDFEDKVNAPLGRPWETSLGNEYVLVPKRSWAEGYFR